MPLGEYRRKRDPSKTPEPFSGSETASGGPIFVVQRHDARRLHYDLRLEEAGALASWAVPKGVPLEPGDRALAVHVEDHPLDYATFEGEIPSGSTAPGRSRCGTKGRTSSSSGSRTASARSSCTASGCEESGRSSRARLDGKEQNWLLIRRSDGAATEEARGVQPDARNRGEQLPHGVDWRYEVKFDGYRALAYIRGGDCRLVSRNGNDLTQRFAKVAQEVVKATKSPHAVLDGEVCRIDDDGRASFSNLQQSGGALAYFVFDLLELDGEPLVDEPFVERKRRLADALDSRNSTVSVSADFEDGDALLEVVKEQQFEGIVAKRASSVYRPGKRTRDWLKLKIDSTRRLRDRGLHARHGPAGTDVRLARPGAEDDGELRYVGNVGTGFDDAEIRRLLELLAPLHRETTPFPERPGDAARAKGRGPVGRAAAARPGPVRRVDARRPPPSSRVSRASRRHARARA